MAKTKKTNFQILEENFTSKLAGKKGVKTRNKAFHKLSDEDKRREIALDSLLLLSSQTIVASHGSYWGQTLDYIRDESIQEQESSEKFQKRLLNVPQGEQCAVCARGAVMLSTVRLGNCLIADTDLLPQGDEDIVQGFSIGRMYEMEREYENSYYHHPYEDNSDAKLANILLNVIVNGDFDIRDKQNYVKSYGFKFSTEHSYTDR